MKKKGKKVMAGRPLMNKHIQRALSGIPPKVEYETRCSKNGH